jgi:DNA-binding MarR family transcriptional regulator
MRILTANARVLLAVLEHPEKTQREIAQMLNMRYQHVWRALDRLVKEGILEKRRQNRRTYFVAAEGFWQMDDIKRLKACVI